MRYRYPHRNAAEPYERVEERSILVDRTAQDIAGILIGVLSFATFFLAVWWMFG